MCGICGIVERSGTPVDAALIERMTASIAHRGPDDAGTWVEGHRSALWRPSAAATARVERRLGRRAHELPTVLADADTALRVAPDLERAATGGRYGAAPVEVARRWRERLAPAMLSDGTATLQGVTDADAPTLATLLHDGGDGVLLATALRLEGRPRPRTPEEIVGAFLASRLDHLWLGPYLVDHPDPA